MDESSVVRDYFGPYCKQYGHIVHFSGTINQHVKVGQTYFHLEKVAVLFHRFFEAKQ